MTLLSKLASGAFRAFSTKRGYSQTPDAIEGCEYEATISYDKYGVPSVVAATPAAVCFGQGVAVAQSRLLQMDLSRRVVRGELAELVGEKGLQTDKLSRQLGLRRLGTQDWQHFLKCGDAARVEEVQAYISGINVVIAECERTGRWPAECAFALSCCSLFRFDLFGVCV